jgi:rSAM/selenodomain-associated transferase 1
MTEGPGRRTLVIFARAPRLGRVKRRLARDIGTVEATRFYRTVLARLLRRVARDPRWRTVIAVTPDRAACEARWTGGRRTMPQGSGDLGRRMARALAAAAPGRVVLIGSDIPAIDRRHVWAAFAALDRAELVFGPAEDGGYWLVGMRRDSGSVPAGFGPVRWSTRHALADSRAGFARGRRVALLDPLADVDDGAGWRRWRASRRP